MSNCLQSTSNNCTHCPTPYPSIVKCGNPTSVTIPQATTLAAPLVVTTVSLDTSCLNNPKIKLQFNSNIIFTSGGAKSGVQMNLQLYRICGNNQKIPVGGAWTYAHFATDKDEVNASTFNFDICECEESCSQGCCLYQLEIISATMLSPGSSEKYPTVTINQATLFAQAFGTNC